MQFFYIITNCRGIKINSYRSLFSVLNSHHSLLSNNLKLTIFLQSQYQMSDMSSMQFARTAVEVFLF